MNEKEFCDDIHGISPDNCNENKVRKFIINVRTSTDNHSLVEFSVPEEYFSKKLSYNEMVFRAGWYYENNIVHCLPTGDYNWRVFPKDLLNDIVSRC